MIYSLFHIWTLFFTKHICADYETSVYGKPAYDFQPLVDLQVKEKYIFLFKLENNILSVRLILNFFLKRTIDTFCF